MITKFGSNFTVVMRNRSRKGWPGGDMVAMDGFAKALVAVGVNVKNNVSKTGQVVVISWNINYPWVLDHLVQAKAAGHHFLVFAFNMNINDKGYQRLVAEYADGIIFITRAEKDSFETYIGLKVKVP